MGVLDSRRIDIVHRILAVALGGLFLAALSSSPAAPQTAQPATSLTELQRQYREALQEIERLKRELAAAQQTIARLQQSPSQTQAASAQPQTYQEAINVLNKVLEKAPQDAQAHRKRGIAYAHIGKYPEALADLSRAIALNEVDAEAYNQRGIVYYELGRYPQAMADFNQAIAKQPKLAESYNNRGVLYKTLGNYQRALSDLRQAEQLDLPYAPKAIEILRAEVRQAQQRLQREGLNPGPADGLPGAATAAALRAYQQQNGLRVTGHLDNRTQQALGLSPASSSASQNAASEAILSRFIDKPPLVYPEQARLQGWEGTVTLRFAMLADGTIGAIEVAKSSGYPILDTAAQKALKQWRHRPPSQQDQPETTWATLDFNFTLDKATDANR
jgi:TonB family protein